MCIKNITGHHQKQRAQRRAEQLAEGFMGSAELWYRSHRLSAGQQGLGERAA